MRIEDCGLMIESGLDYIAEVREMQRLGGWKTKDHHEGTKGTKEN